MQGCWAATVIIPLDCWAGLSAAPVRLTQGPNHVSRTQKLTQSQYIGFLLEGMAAASHTPTHATKPSSQD